MQNSDSEIAKINLEQQVPPCPWLCQNCLEMLENAYKIFNTKICQCFEKEKKPKKPKLSVCCSSNLGNIFKA